MRPLAACVFTLLITGCAIPKDPDGTLDDVRGGTLRVGVTAADPWVVDKAEGVEIELIEDFAATLDAEVRFEDGSEAVLLERLKAGELDLVAGGFDEKTPWITHGAPTRPYLEVREEQDSGPANVGHVMLAPLGENAFLVELEEFLDAHEAEAKRLLTEAGGP